MSEDLIVDYKELVFQKQYELVNTILMKEQEITDLKKEEQTISSKRKFLEAQLDSFKAEIKKVLEENGIDKITTEAGNLSIRLNPISVEVIDIDKVPDEYKTAKITFTVDKKRITENFKATGEIIEGVQINTQNTSLQVK